MLWTHFFFLFCKKVLLFWKMDNLQISKMKSWGLSILCFFCLKKSWQHNYFTTTIKFRSYTSGTQKNGVFLRRRAEPADNRQSISHHIQSKQTKYYKQKSANDFCSLTTKNDKKRQKWNQYLCSNNYAVKLCCGV